MEQTLEIRLLLAGLAILFVGWVWLTVKAFRQSIWWGLACLVPPLFLLFISLRPRRAWLPAVTMLVGFLLGASPLAVNRLLPIDLKEREFPNSNGELVIQLTGWDNSDPSGVAGAGRRLSRWLHHTVNGWDVREYSVLATKTDVVILQMSNPDVTDETLEYLRPLKKLRELHLADTGITNEGLRVLHDLPALTILRLQRTAITDEGIRDHLTSLKSLKRLDLSGTKVTPLAREEWKRAVPGRMAIQQ